MKDFELPNGKKIKGPVALGLIILIVIIIVAFMMFFIVDQTEQAVVLRFGKFNRLTEPGLHFKLPLGIERMYKVPTQVILKEEFGFRTLKAGVETVYSGADFPEESIMLTGDLNIVDVEWIIQYRINDPLKWLFQVDNQNKTIRDISQSVVNLLVGDRGILDVIGSERARIEVTGQEMMNKLFDKYNLGIRVTTLKSIYFIIINHGSNSISSV
jgi:membrane protease subunit HflK